MKTVYLAQGCCETIVVNGEERADAFKINRGLLGDEEPKKNEIVNVAMPNGFMYKGQIYLKTKNYAYIYLY